MKLDLLYLLFYCAKLWVQSFKVIPVVSFSIHSCLNIPESHLAQSVQQEVAHFT